MAGLLGMNVLDEQGNPAGISTNLMYRILQLEYVHTYFYTVHAVTVTLYVHIVVVSPITQTDVLKVTGRNIEQQDLYSFAFETVSSEHVPEPSAG